MYSKVKNKEISIFVRWNDFWYYKNHAFHYIYLLFLLSVQLTNDYMIDRFANFWLIIIINSDTNNPKHEFFS